MGIGEAITKFFHDMGILELRIRNEHPAYAKLSYNSSLYLDIISPIRENIPLPSWQICFTSQDLLSPRKSMCWKRLAM